MCLRWILLIWSVFVYDGSAWIQSPSVYVYVCVSTCWTLRLPSSVKIAVLVHWSCEALARRLSDCLQQQGLPNSHRREAMTAARLWLAPLLVVIARLSIDMDVILLLLVFFVLP
jgi:hypothetical protein